MSATSEMFASDTKLCMMYWRRIVGTDVWSIGRIRFVSCVVIGQQMSAVSSLVMPPIVGRQIETLIFCFADTERRGTV